MNQTQRDDAIDLMREIATLKELNAELRAEFEEIAKTEGPFNRDPLQHAINCIENMAEIARAAIAKVEATP